MVTTTVFVYTMNQVGAVGAWCRYVFPFRIDHFTQLGNDLYIRSDDDVLRVVNGALSDYGNDLREVGFDGVVQWPYLDFGAPGVNKLLVGFDMVGTGTSIVEIGYNQAIPTTFTTAFEVPEDTVPGLIIPLGVMAPSLSVKITYAAGQKWQFNALNLYLNDMRPGT